MSGAEIYLNWFYHFCTVNAETSVFENSSSGAPKMIFFSFLFSPLELKHPFFFSLSLNSRDHLSTVLNRMTPVI